MSRPFNPDLSTAWKINLPATLAGQVEFALLDPVHQKPIYGARNRLIGALLTRWLAEQSGRTELPHVPSILELRDRTK